MIYHLEGKKKKGIFKRRQCWVSPKIPSLAVLPTHSLDQEYSDKNLNPDHCTGI